MSPKTILYNFYKSTEKAKEHELKKVLSKLPKDGVFLDVGCWDGTKTNWWAKALKPKKVIGIEIIPNAVKVAKKKGIEAYVCNIEDKWPIKNNSTDVVLSNLVIEHLNDVDQFISESYRVLKKGGYTIVCTNNLSSWHNIISLLFGWAPFDLTNSSSKRWSIGNPLVVHKNKKSIYGKTFTHKCVYTARWLKEWYELFGFKFFNLKTAGYYPFPSFLGKLDKRHAAYIILVFKK
jgi:ubiquinone/menaquinone biosynthesis C-methylase UbiE